MNLKSDFPDFDAAYNTVLVKDLEDRFEQLASQANFNIYHSDIWRGTARRFAELIVRECASIVEEGVMIRETSKDTYASLSTANIIREHFGVKEN